MKIIKTEKKLCPVCMEKHNVQTVIVEDVETFGGKEITFNAIYEYCANADEYFETESLIRTNKKTMEKAYNCNILCSEDACVICGDYVPEGQQVCPACKKDPQQVLKE